MSVGAAMTVNPEKLGYGGEWCETTIGSQVKLQRGVDITKAEQRPGQVPVISSSGVSSHHDTAAAKGPGVVLGRKGVVGSVWFIETDYWPHDTTLWVKDFCGNHPRFVYYFFKSIVRRISSLDVGSANPTLNRNHVHPIEVLWPPLAQQRAITHILGTLDDKIELNRQRNQTLEAMARAMFQDWFVDFGPVRAKMEGREPYLPADLWSLFPDRLDDEGKPEGWGVEPLTEVFDFKEGPGIRNWQYTNTDEGTRFINIRCIKDGDLFVETANRITDEEANGKYAHFHLQSWDVVVSTSGTLGRSAIVRKEHLPLVLNTSVIRFRSITNRMLFCFLYQYLNSNEFLTTLESMASGSVQKNFGPVHLKQMKLIYPGFKLIAEYETVCRPILEKLIEIKSHNDYLAQIRDTLLPKLISGELRIKDAERFLENSV